MINLYNFDDWTPYDGAAEGSGRSEKIWLKSPKGIIGLFKYPKIDPKDNKETTEHISEHISYKLGELLNIRTAKVDLGIRDNRIGCMSYFVCEPNEKLLEGIGFISGRYPLYNAETMQNEEDGTYYCLEHLFNSIPNTVPQKFWLDMLMFDFLIGNTDRHQSNWAVLSKIVSDKEFTIQTRPCPLYDNGSSLCCYVNTAQLKELLGKDKNRFNALVDSKSLSIIRISGKQKKRPTHREMVKYLMEKYTITKSIAYHFLETLSCEGIDKLLDEYPEDLISKEKCELIKRYIIKKLEILESLLTEVAQ